MNPWLQLLRALIVFDRDDGGGSGGTGGDDGDDGGGGDDGGHDDGDLFDDDGGGDDGGDGGDGGGSDDRLDEDQVLARLEQRLGERFDAIADRRINSLLDRMERQGRSRRGRDDRGRGDDRGGDGDRGRQQDRTPVADVRAARSAFREYVGDSGLRFIDPEERQLAMDLGAALIGARAVDGFDDEDAVGREVADKVVKQVQALRKLYQRKTREELKRRGVLADDGKGQHQRGPRSAGAASEYEKGAQQAKEMFKERLPAS